MYSTVGLLKNAKRSGRLTGTHQKLDRVARGYLSRLLEDDARFPSAKEILHFEGVRGPDGIKMKSPGKDEPMHFILPDHDDGKLVEMAMNHQYNLGRALEKDDLIRAAFEAAWLAHVLTDGLTPAHHFPYEKAISDLMSGKDYVKIFGRPVKGIMRGNSISEAAHNNRLYWGPEGFMTKHVVFEYNVAVAAISASTKRLTPVIHSKTLENIDLKSEFYRSLKKIHNLDMYERFRYHGWTPKLTTETLEILLPEIVRIIILGWYSAVPDELKLKKEKNA